MTPERWQQVEQLLEEVLAQPPAARGEFLSNACVGDAALQQEVESLLRFHQEDDFLAALPAALAAEVVTAQDELTGQQFGPYLVERRLGQGGVGVVHLARDTRLGRPVALKLLQAQFTQDPERVRRFQQEARAASSLNHPNILTIYEVGQAPATAGSAHFIAAEFVAGETLRARLRDGVLPPEKALDCTSQIAAALEAAHAAGIVHRDIKPENVMLRPDSFVKVLDFGLAKLTEAKAQDWDVLRTSDAGSEKPTLPRSHARSRTTRPGMVMGTVAYMSPEQARGLEVDARSDLFSLGIVLYEMLTGARPFTGETPTDVLTALIEYEPPPLPDHLLAEKSEARAELQRIVSRALAKPLDKRYQAASAMLDDLKRLRQELEFAAKLRAAATEREVTASGRAGQQALENQTASQAGETAARAAAKMTFPLDYLSRHRLAAFALALFVLLGVGGTLGARWLTGRGSAFDSIAVLPFVNVGNDPQMEYLSDGLTESLIGSLSQLPGLQVMARNTVFTYKGREVDPRQVGADLKVRAVLMGRVLRQGERLRIHAELVDTANGVRLWGDEYKQTLADLLAVEREITREISTGLRLHLNSGQQQQMVKRQTTNNEAYQLYLLGRHLYLQHTRASQEKALAYFNQAIALDPNYALAHAWVAQVYAAFSAQYLQPSDAIPKARQAAQTAIGLDETLPEGHYSLALVKLWGDWDWAGAEYEYKRAIELNPSFFFGHVGYANFLSQQGRFAEALRVASRAQELDPLSPQASISLSQTNYFARQYDQALVHLRKAVELSPNEGDGYVRLGLVFSQQGKHQEAIAELRRALALGQEHSFRAWLAYVYARAGERAAALKLLRELETLAQRERVSPVYLARIYTGLGERDRAFAWLRKAYEERSDHLLGLGQHPVYDPLRSDPRFSELLRGLGLTP